jgi:c-di-GMP-related signal transduction protein
MEILGEEQIPGTAHDALFLTGIFSCLDRLLRRPMAEALALLPIPDEVRDALLNNGGPYATLLAVAKASESFGQSAARQRKSCASCSDSLGQRSHGSLGISEKFADIDPYRCGQRQKMA